MPKIKSTLIAKVTLILCVLLCTVIALSLMYQPVETYAMSTGSGSKVVYAGIDTDGDGKSELTELAPQGVIDGDVLLDLLKKLGADSSESDLDEAIKAVHDLGETPADTSASLKSKKWYKGYTAKQINATNGGNDVIVKFGGLDWTVVYLSNDRNGDPVATLWLTDSSQLGIGKSAFTGWTADATQYQTGFAYPENMYSTSLLRSKLNLGTGYASGTTSSLKLNTTTQSETHALAPFTMTQSQLDAAGATDKFSVIQFIDMPYLIEYQETESYLNQNGYYYTDEPTLNTINMPNDAYGIPAKTTQSTWNTNTNGHNARGYCTYSSSNFDYNSYALIEAITGQAVTLTGNYATYVTNANNGSTAKNMKSTGSGVLSSLYSESDGKKTWKKTEEWSDDDFNLMHSWTDGESWAFDTVWIPSWQEAGMQRNDVLSDDPPNSLWKTTKAQRVNSEDQWLRSGNYNGVQNSYRLTAAGGYPVDGSSYALCSSSLGVRPALHLNLNSAALGAAGVRRPQIKDADADTNGTVKTVVYSGSTAVTLAKPLPKDRKTEEKLLTVAVEKDGTTVTAATYFNYDTATFTAQDSGTYKLKFTPKEGTVWLNGNTTEESKTETYELTIVIKKADISGVTFGANAENQKQNQAYLYHVDATENAVSHKIELLGQVGLVNSRDSGSIKIYYKTVTNDSIKTEAALADWVSSQAAPADNDWATQAPDLSTPGGYIVWFKIEATNHNAYYGSQAYMSVLIKPLELVFKLNDTTGQNALPAMLYGDTLTYGLQTEAGLYSYLVSSGNRLSITDNDGRAYDPNDFKESNIRFYFTSQESGREATGEPWDAGKYFLNIAYHETGVSTNVRNYITFKWDPARPALNVGKRDTTVNWTGNSLWNNTDYVNTAASSERSKFTTPFHYVYNGQLQSPTATYTDYTGQVVNLSDITVTGNRGSGNDGVWAGSFSASANSLINNYNVTNASQTYEIHKAANGWKVEFFAETQYVGQPVNKGVIYPQPIFGSVLTTKYYTDSECSSPTTLPSGKWRDATTYYFEIIVEGHSANYEGLTFRGQLEVRECLHNGGTRYGSDGTQHWQECDVCGNEVEGSRQNCTPTGPLVKGDTEHWKVCDTCGNPCAKSAHDYKQGTSNKTATCEVLRTDVCDCGAEHVVSLGYEHTPGGLITENGNPNHWRICSTCNQKVEETTHDYKAGAYVVGQEPTCVSPGQQNFVCDCGANEVRSVNATGVHTRSTNWQSDGNEHYRYCTVCYEELDKGSCRPAEIPAQDATCTVPGKTAGSQCLVCGYVYTKQETIPAQGHIFNTTPSQVLVEATCESAGAGMFECQICHETQRQAIAKLAHNLVHYAYKAATTTATGNIEYWRCSMCTKYFRDNSAIPDEISPSEIVIPMLSGEMDPGHGGGGTTFSEWFSANWWWILIIVVVVLLFILVLWILSYRRQQRLEAERREHDKQMMEMLIQSQQLPTVYPQPMMTYAQSAEPLQLPASIDEDTLANAIAKALHGMGTNAQQAEAGDGFDDADGFYDPVDGNEF